MKKSPSKGGATALMIVSIAILAASVIVTLVFALRARQGGDLPPADAESRPGSEASAPAETPQRPADAQQAPDWLADESYLDELAAQPWEPQPDPATLDNDGGETPPDTPQPADTPPDTPPAAFVNPFSDVKESDYFYEPLMWAAQSGIVSGDAFSPASVCSRAQAVTFLWRQQGEPEPKLGVSPFTDVSQSDYFYQPVLWAFESGLISTPSDGKFKPSDAINRAQVMTFLFRVSGGSAKGLSNPYSNVSPGDYYYEPALWAYSRGIVILDDGASAFDATSACTRAQFITFLYRCFAADAQGGQ